MSVSDPWIVEQKWDITYRHTADPVTARFLQSLRDDGTLLGIRCPECQRVLAPPRPICDRDFCDTDPNGWVELGSEGVLELFTIMYLKIEGLREPPYVLAYIRPDGADTALPGVIEDVDLSSPEKALEVLKLGARVQILMRPEAERRGRITDMYFRMA